MKDKPEDLKTQMKFLRVGKGEGGLTTRAVWEKGREGSLKHWKKSPSTEKGKTG